MASSEIGIVEKAIKASDEVGSFHEAPLNAKLNLLAERTKDGAVKPVELGVDPSTGSGGGLL